MNKEEFKKEAANFSDLASEKSKKFLGGTRYRKGLTLYALNNDTAEVYEVEIKEKGEDHEGSEKERGKLMADIHPDHKMLWALNKASAIRKFRKDEKNFEIFAPISEVEDISKSGFDRDNNGVSDNGDVNTESVSNEEK